MRFRAKVRPRPPSRSQVRSRQPRWSRRTTQRLLMRGPLRKEYRTARTGSSYRLLIGRSCFTGLAVGRGAANESAAKSAAKPGKTVGQYRASQAMKPRDLNSRALVWASRSTPEQRVRPSSKRLLGQLPGRGWVRLPCTSATRFELKISTSVLNSEAVRRASPGTPNRAVFRDLLPICCQIVVKTQRAGTCVRRRSGQGHHGTNRV